MSDWSTLRATHRRPLRVALLPCAGRGERAGGGRPKQYVEVSGRSVVHWTLLAFDELVRQGQLDGVAVVLSPGDEEFVQAVPPALRERLQVMPVGGATRAHSVWGGLQALAREGLDETDWVLVHDAARCLIVPADVRRLIELGCNDPVGALLARPMSDTVKRAQTSASPPRVSHTEDREGLWLAQTPQMFRLGQLATAYAQAGTEVTDEASAMQAMGLQPLLVASEGLNLKVTYPQDFEWASAWLHRHTHKDAS